MSWHRTERPRRCSPPPCSWRRAPTAARAGRPWIPRGQPAIFRAGRRASRARRGCRPGPTPRQSRSRSRNRPTPRRPRSRPLRPPRRSRRRRRRPARRPRRLPRRPPRTPMSEDGRGRGRRARRRLVARGGPRGRARDRRPAGPAVTPTEDVAVRLRDCQAEAAWLTRELVPELRRSGSREQVAGGWAVSSARVRALEDSLTALEATSPDEPSGAQARALRDAVRAARVRVEALVAPGSGLSTSAELAGVSNDLELALRQAGPESHRS